MDQACDVRETAVFVRRVVRRTLTVVGGAAAGTAIAWCLSSASASADTPTDSLGDRNPALAEVVAPLGDTLDTVAEHLSDPPAPPASIPNPIKDIGDRFTKSAEPVDTIPVCPDVACGITDPSDDVNLGRTEPEVAPPAAPPAPVVGTVAGAGVDPERTAERTATGRAHSDGMSRRGSPDTGMSLSPPSLRDLPTWPAPFSPAPPSAPAPGHTGHAGGTSVDSPVFAAPPSQHRTPGPAGGLTASATEATTFGRPGAQPGTAPD